MGVLIIGRIFCLKVDEPITEGRGGELISGSLRYTKKWHVNIPGTIPKALDLSQEGEVDEHPTLQGNLEDTEMLEEEVHRDSVVGIPVADHRDHAGHPFDYHKNNFISK